jgi:hypothetical protein
MEKNASSDARTIEYERPKIVDYGSLSELTKAGGLPNSDSPSGDSNTAFSSRH